jgi:hypothetical protein
MKTYAFLWNEEQAGKGSCEACTCIFEFLKIKQRNGANVRYIFYDRCGGQKSNRMMHIILSIACTELLFKEVNLIFLCT